MIKTDKNSLFKAYLEQKQIKKIYFGKDLIYQAPSDGLAYRYDAEYDGYFVKITESCTDTYITIPEYFWTEANGWNDVLVQIEAFFLMLQIILKLFKYQIR